jgi:hypothetical protein
VGGRKHELMPIIAANPGQGAIWSMEMKLTGDILSTLNLHTNVNDLQQGPFRTIERNHGNKKK